MPISTHYVPAAQILELDGDFYDPVEAAWFPEKRLRFRNQRWASAVGLGELSAEEWKRHFCELEALPDNLTAPLALRYHGHQFDSYNPHLGDGRGFLFAQLKGPWKLGRSSAPEQRSASATRLLDLGTKGSGQTPYSRGGDGRLTLKGGVREVLATEMLEALGVNTSKTFSLYETGEALLRGDEPSPTRSSVLVRLSHSHVRIGTFQRLLHGNDVVGLRKLVDYCSEHLLPEVRGHENAPLALLHDVCRSSANLCAQWLVAGFVHGVLNSDNMTVTGESFDYGPYRFLPVYDADFVAAYFDHSGLYAFGRQPRAVYKNLQRLAQCLAVLDPSAPWASALDAYVETLRRARVTALLCRLGLNSAGPDEDETLAEACWDFLSQRLVGYDQFFHDWWGGPASVARAAESPASQAYASAEFRPLRALLDTQEPRAAHHLENPYFQRPLPCSLLIDEIEAIFASIAERDDWQPFDAKIDDMRLMGEMLHVRSPGA